jgi:hypothetical protein
MSIRVCNACGIEKPLSGFHKQKDAKKGHRTICKVCCNSRSKAYKIANPLANREIHLRNKFGITHAEYLNMLEAQNGRCKICKTDTPMGNGAFHVDHCHTTNRVRGLLCHKCNVGLGHFNDNISLLSAAIFYLNEDYDEPAPSD